MALMNTYGEPAVTLVRGEGVYLWDNHGRRYLDALAGIAVCGLGHAHPGVAAAICERAHTGLHLSNYFRIEQQVELGTRLAKIAGMDKVFFSNSGAEANEAAIKLVRRAAHARGIAAPQIITFKKSFHGRTMGALSATGNTKIQQGFGPLLEGFVHVPFNDIDAVAAAGSEHTAAVMLEPIQGEGGVNPAQESFLKDLRQLCDARGWLLVFDEIQTGNGRTGKYFAYQHSGVMPDVVTTAKGLGNGVPIGACLARGTAAEVLQPGSHGSTFGGNPLACSAGLAVVDALADGAILANVREQGDWLLGRFRELLEGETKVRDIRGRGLMLGIELDRPCGSLMAAARERGLLINVTAGNVIRLLPPLIIERAHAEEIAAVVAELIKDFKGEG